MKESGVSDNSNPFHQNDCSEGFKVRVTGTEQFLSWNWTVGSPGVTGSGLLFRKTFLVAFQRVNWNPVQVEGRSPRWGHCNAPGQQG